MHKFMTRVAFTLAVAAGHAASAYTFEVVTNDTVVSVNFVDSETTQSILEESFLAPDVTRVEYHMNGNVIHLRPTEPSTYAGGTSVLSGQVRISEGNELGYGPVVLGSGVDGPAMLVADADCTVTNKIVFSNDVAWAMSAGPDYTLTVNRIAARRGSGAARFGRSNNPCSVNFDLADDEGNEPVRALAFRGAVSGELGGTLKVSQTPLSPFLRNTQSGNVNNVDRLRIADKGLILDVPVPAQIRLTDDVELANPARYSIHEPQAVVPADADFEDGGAGWSGKKIDSGAGDSVPGVMPNNDQTWIRGRTTPFGDKCMVQRTGHRLTSPEIEIPSNGVWHLSFWRAGRAQYSGYDMPTEIGFTNLESGETQTQTLAGMEADNDRFEHAVSPGFELTAGRYRFTLYPKLKNSTAAMTYDNFRVEPHDGFVYPRNPDFEQGTTEGWSIVNVDSAASGEFLSGVYANGNTYNPSRLSPSGRFALMLRTGHQLTSSPVVLPVDGTWRLAFKRVGREGHSGSASPTDIVFTDVATGVAVTNVLAGFADSPQYVDAASAPFNLKAGTYTFSIHPHVKSNFSMFYDSFVVQRVESERLPDAGRITKRGDGELVVTGQANPFENAFTAEAGVLRFLDASFADAILESRAGGSLVIGSGTYLDAQTTVTVEAGARLGIDDLKENLVKNGSFERNDLSTGTQSASNGFLSGVGHIADWSLVAVVKNKQNSDGSNPGGVLNNANTISPLAPATPAGTYAACVRQHCRLYQTVEIPEAGDYRISFLYVWRNGYADSTTAGRVELVDANHVTNTVTVLAERVNDKYARCTKTLPLLQSGTYTLVFRVDVGEDTSGGPWIQFDDVSLRQVGSLPEPGGTLALAEGATLELNNTVPLELPRGAVTVGGREVTGARGALERHGVKVTGEGKIQIGLPDGTMLFLR